MPFTTCFQTDLAPLLAWSNAKQHAWDTATEVALISTRIRGNAVSVVPCGIKDAQPKVARTKTSPTIQTTRAIAFGLSTLVAMCARMTFSSHRISPIDLSSFLYCFVGRPVSRLYQGHVELTVDMPPTMLRNFLLALRSSNTTIEARTVLFLSILLRWKIWSSLLNTALASSRGISRVAALKIPLSWDGIGSTLATQLTT